MLTIPMCKITIQHLIFKEVVGMVCVCVCECMCASVCVHVCVCMCTDCVCALVLSSIQVTM